MHYSINLCIDLCMHIIRRIIGSDRNYRQKLHPSVWNRRTSDGLPLRRGHPNWRQTNQGFVKFNGRITKQSAAKQAQKKKVFQNKFDFPEKKNRFSSNSMNEKPLLLKKNHETIQKQTKLWIETWSESVENCYACNPQDLPLCHAVD